MPLKSSLWRANPDPVNCMYSSTLSTQIISSWCPHRGSENDSKKTTVVCFHLNQEALLYKCNANFGMFAIQFENSLSFHTTPVPEDEGSRFKLTDFIQRCKQINGAADPLAGPRPLGCSEQTSKTYFNYRQGSLSGFLRLNCQRFSVSSCPNTGTPAGKCLPR